MMIRNSSGSYYNLAAMSHFWMTAQQNICAKDGYDTYHLGACPSVEKAEAVLAWLAKRATGCSALVMTWEEVLRSRPDERA